ncbi:chaperone protein HscA [Holospora obtusa F1]|uniref:Chaperone protein HscA n=1 Tax=Holospora obtusa F1 TaxID=1399147 RepID=W6TED0_HOLOB|nr:Hsp70 family protein [Holospora obtusa]ETZ07548.1 chaperone protein HscA [Holospora obtusa F1]
MRILVDPFNSIIEKNEKFLATEAVGIDFGTTYCVVALASSPTEAYVLSSSKGTLISSQITTKDGNSVGSVKRKLAHIEISDPIYDDYLSAAVSIFKLLATHIYEALGRVISRAVITVPAYFDDVQRSHIHKAATLAGFDVLRLINEPTAAALTYGLTQDSEGKYLVYDWGGGTFDVSILDIQQGIFRVLSSGGDTALGGDDLDFCIAQHISPLSLEDQSFLQQQYWIREARRIKESLSRPYFCDVGDLETKITPEDLETWCFPWFQRTLDICQDTLNRANLEIQDIQKLILVGGSTRIPFVFKRLTRLWDGKIDSVLHPEYAVAQGAALQAYQLTNTCSFLLLDVSPLTLGVEVLGGLIEPLIPRNTPLPAKATYKFTTAVDGQTKMRLHIVQGEKEFAKQCKSLGVFELSGIDPLPKGIPHIELTCHLTVEGLLELEAKECKQDKGGVNASLKINTIRTLDDAQIQEELYALNQNDGSEVLLSIWIKKHQQASDGLHQMEKILQQFPYLFSKEEHCEMTKICKNFSDFLNIEPSHCAESLKEISEKWEIFSSHILPYIERHLTEILKQTLEHEKSDFF